MSGEEVLKVLRDLGLSKRESEVYIFLSQYGMQQVTAISTRLKIERVQTYRILKNLQDKGMIEATLESPARFAAVSFGDLLDSLVRTKKSEATKLEAKRKNLLDYWENLSAKNQDYSIPRFRVLVGQKRIYSEILRLINDAKDELLVLTTGLDVVYEDLSGILDSMVRLPRKNKLLQLKMLTSVIKENMKIVEKKLSDTTGNLNFQWRHMDVGSGIYPQFMIRDGKETILYLTYGNKTPRASQPDSGLCISSEMFVSALRQSFMEIWRNAAPAEERIAELRTGKPTAETLVIRNPEEAQAKVAAVLGSAEKDAVAIVSSDMLNGALKNEILTYSKNPFKFRVMAPIDLDNLKEAAELSESCEIRSVPISYLTMMSVDNKHLFLFKSPFKKPSAENFFKMENLFYTNDQRYVERVCTMLEDIWKRGTDVRELVSGKARRIPGYEVSGSDPVAKAVDYMITAGINSVVVVERGSPVGIISERDILEKVVKPRKDPEKTSARTIMSIPIVSVESDEPMVEAMKIMKKTGMRKVAVFKDGKLNGMFRMDETV